MLPALEALIALQDTDTAVEAAQKRLAELPAAEIAIAAAIAAAAAEVEQATSRLAENHNGRRELEKLAAAVETRLGRFDEHRAAVKTNHEYTALLHEIEGAKSEKDGLEDRILETLEQADALSADVRRAEQALAEATRDGQSARAELGEERERLEEDVQRLTATRGRQAAALDAALVARYEQLVKQRKGVAVAAMRGESCAACHVRLRPHFTQQIRRNDAIIECESCQRILYFEP